MKSLINLASHALPFVLLGFVLASCGDPKWDDPEAARKVCDPNNPSPWAPGACEYIRS